MSKLTNIKIVDDDIFWSEDTCGGSYEYRADFPTLANVEVRFWEKSEHYTDISELPDIIQQIAKNGAIPSAIDLQD